MMINFYQWLSENINATLYTHSDSKGASIETDDNHEENIQLININQIINYEPKSKMINPKSMQNKENIKNDQNPNLQVTLDFIKNMKDQK
jgi:hypothetical protein